MGLSWVKTYELIEGLPCLVELVLLVVEDSCYYADVVVRYKKVEYPHMHRQSSN